MAVQLLTSVIYEVVQDSWTVISITAKYYVLGVLLYLQYQDRLSLEEVTEKFIDDSRLFIGAMVLAGAVLHASGASISPLFKFFSQLVALGYLGYLFWEY